MHLFFKYYRFQSNVMRDTDVELDDAMQISYVELVNAMHAKFTWYYTHGNFSLHHLMTCGDDDAAI